MDANGGKQRNRRKRSIPAWRILTLPSDTGY